MIQNNLRLRIILMIFFAVLLLPAFSQQNDIGTDLLPVRLGDKWGYINGSGEVVITPQYESVAMNVYAGTPIVKKGGVYFLVDSMGNRIDDRHYKSLSFYGSGFIVAEKEKKWGGINFKGQETIPFVFDDMKGFIDGYSIAELDSAIGVVDTQGVFIKLDGYNSLENAGEGFIRTSKVQKETGRILYGLYDAAKKRTVVEPVLNSLSYIRNGKAVYGTVEGEVGLMDCKNGEFQRLKYDMIMSGPDQHYQQVKWYDSLYVIEKNGKYGLIDQGGREILKPELRSDYQPFLADGFICYCYKDQCGVMDKNGNVKKIPDTDYVQEVMRGFVVQANDGLFGVMTLAGAVILPSQYSRISFHSADIIVLFTGSGSIYDEQTETKMGYANSNGKIIWTPSN